MNQHYIPICYLNEFVNKSDKTFFTLNINDVFKYNQARPKQKHPKQIAKEKNFYTIDFELSEYKSVLKDIHQLGIERSFHLYENKYSKILNKIFNKEKLKFEEAFLLSYSFVDFKLRNKFFRENSIEKNKVSILNEIGEKMINELSKEIINKFNISFETANLEFEKLKIKILNNSNYSKEQHLRGLVERKINEDGILFSIAKELLKSRWIILKSNSTGFITSDNPGFCLDKDENAFNTKFKEGFIFIIPLSNEYCLYADNNTKFQNENIDFKELEYLNCPLEMIKLINKGTCFNVNRFIVSSNKSILINQGNSLISEASSKK